MAWKGICVANGGKAVVRGWWLNESKSYGLVGATEPVQAPPSDHRVRIFGEATNSPSVTVFNSLSVNRVGRTSRI